jgi:hypothetical protein
MRSLCFSIATGEPPLKSGAAQSPGDVLYLDWEGTYDSNHSEQIKMFPGNRPDLGRVTYLYEAPRFDELWSIMGEWHGRADNPRAVVIDIYSKAKPLAPPRGVRKLVTPDLDNLTLEPLKLWAEQHGVCVFILVHLNPKKPISESDPVGSLGNVIGSSALIGTPD